MLSILYLINLIKYIVSYYNNILFIFMYHNFNIKKVLILFIILYQILFILIIILNGIVFFSIYLFKDLITRIYTCYLVFFLLNFKHN